MPFTVPRQPFLLESAVSVFITKKAVGAAYRDVHSLRIELIAPPLSFPLSDWAKREKTHVTSRSGTLIHQGILGSLVRNTS